MPSPVSVTVTVTLIASTTADTVERTGKMVRGRDRVVTDGPYPESKDLVGGYSLIEAKDLEQAAERAKGCPTFDLGGVVEGERRRRKAETPHRPSFLLRRSFV